MVELLAVAPAAEPERRGVLERLGRLLFMSAANRINESMEVHIKRLGLATTQRPEERTRAASRVPDYVGPTIVKGERHGRSVEIRMDPERYRVRLGTGAVPEFHVRSENGELRASGRSPAWVHEALAGLLPHARWKGAEAKGGPDGVTVFHKVQPGGWGGPAGAYYLDDLWLAERLADAAPAGSPEAAGSP
jgi:hypothetical protein